MKAVTIAEDLGLQEGKDFFLIKDCCLTELEPEEIGEDVFLTFEEAKEKLNK